MFVHEYVVAGHRVRGVVGALALAGSGRVVLPHEGVDLRVVGSTASALRISGLDPAPILLTHLGSTPGRDLLDRITADPPDLVSSAARFEERWWQIPAGLVAETASVVAGTQALIADGHHRYAAHCRLAHEVPGWDRALVMLVDHQDTPLSLDPLHRHVRGVLFENAAEDARVHTRLATARREAGPRDLVVSDGSRFAVVAAPDNVLPVIALHETLLPRWGALPDEVNSSLTMRAALARCRQDGGIAIAMPPLDLTEVIGVARAGGLLPRKSTWFAPKPRRGLVTREVRPS